MIAIFNHEYWIFSNFFHGAKNWFLDILHIPMISHESHGSIFPSIIPVVPLWHQVLQEANFGGPHTLAITRHGPRVNLIIWEGSNHWLCSLENTIWKYIENIWKYVEINRKYHMEIYRKYMEIYRKYMEIYGNRSKIYGNISKITYGNISKIYGNRSKIYGNRSKIYGNISKIYGNISKIYGNIWKYIKHISKIYRKKNIYIYIWK